MKTPGRTSVLPGCFYGIIPGASHIEGKSGLFQRERQRMDFGGLTANQPGAKVDEVEGCAARAAANRRQTAPSKKSRDQRMPSGPARPDSFPSSTQSSRRTPRGRPCGSNRGEWRKAEKRTESREWRAVALPALFPALQSTITNLEEPNHVRHCRIPRRPRRDPDHL